MADGGGVAGDDPVGGDAVDGAVAFGEGGEMPGEGSGALVVGEPEGGDCGWEGPGDVSEAEVARCAGEDPVGEEKGSESDN